LTWALEHSIPTVGVCRGLHTIHSYLGGQLEPVTSTEAHVACEHALELENDLAVAVGSGAGLPARPVVNSFHRQRVSGTLPELRVTGMTPDGTVELVDHASGPLRAAQFHPERDGCDPSLTRWLFEPLLTV
jgi:putative glutamine amidotransferase